VIGVLPAQILARLLGAIAAFFGHKLWVFGHPDLRTPVVALQGLGYALLWLLSLALSLSVLAALTQGLGVAPLAAKLFTEALVLILNFSVLRLLIFRHRRGDRPGGRGRAPVVTAKCLP
jgi:putative flippase GtrA